MPKDKTSPRPVSPAAHARLSAWAARRPVLALMGEFSAGKSTLLNMLIGQAVLPTQVTATKLPPVWLRYGEAAPYWVDRQNRRHPVALEALGSVPLEAARYIRIHCQAEVLESCDLMDTPGISDPNLPLSLWQPVLGLAQAVLWCTHAGQPWRESERAAFENLPERLRRHSLLLVTRADKITSERDREKIDARLERETGALFAQRLFLSLTQALSALEGEGDPDLWAASGAEAFVEHLAETIAALGADSRAPLARYRIDRTAEPPVQARRVRREGREAEASETLAPSGPSADVIPLRAPRADAAASGAAASPVAGQGPVLVLHNRIATADEPASAAAPSSLPISPAPGDSAAGASPSLSTAPPTSSASLAPEAEALLAQLVAGQTEAEGAAALAPTAAPGTEAAAAPQAAPGPIFALWQAALAGRNPAEPSDLAQAIGDFAAALDGAGFTLTPAGEAAASPGPGRRRRS